MLAGKKEGSGYSPPVALKDRAGRILRLGQYWDYDKKKWTGVADSKFKDSLGIGAAAVDWDQDGDLDLVLGANDGTLFVRRNEGTKTEPAFATESIQVTAGKTPLQVPGQHLIPAIVDWDGDGRFDILSGGGEGGVFWFENVGKPGAPSFVSAQTLVTPRQGGAGSQASSTEGAAREPTWPGQRTQVCAADFDGDGDLDLLVGDYSGVRHGWVWLFLRR